MLHQVIRRVEEAFTPREISLSLSTIGPQALPSIIPYPLQNNELNTDCNISETIHTFCIPNPTHSSALTIPHLHIPKHPIPSISMKIYTGQIAVPLSRSLHIPLPSNIEKAVLQYTQLLITLNRLNHYMCISRTSY